MKKVPKWLLDNSMSLSFAALFIICFAAQIISGQSSYNHTLTFHGQSPLSYTEYIGTGNFLAGVLSNWQAALLQLGCLIVFGEFLYQKGAAHSRKPKDEPDDPHPHQVRHRSWIYRNSLSLAFALLFTITFVGHALAQTSAYNEARELTGQPSIPMVSYLLTGSFWFKTMQTWQAEFFAIGLFLVLSIFLRQEGSAESKPVDSSDDETGEANK